MRRVVIVAVICLVLPSCEYGGIEFTPPGIGYDACVRAGVGPRSTLGGELEGQPLHEVTVIGLVSVHETEAGGEPCSGPAVNAKSEVTVEMWHRAPNGLALRCGDRFDEVSNDTASAAVFNYQDDYQEITNSNCQFMDLTVGTWFARAYGKAWIFGEEFTSSLYTSPEESRRQGPRLRKRRSRHAPLLAQRR